MKLHEVWIFKAENDLKSAKKLIDGDIKILDTAIYHTQQCGEKALKAYLAFKNEEIKKTHDIENLINMCSETDEEFSTLLDYGVELTPYGTEYRYPDIELIPELEEVENAIIMAEKIIEFVKLKLHKKSDMIFMIEK